MFIDCYDSNALPVPYQDRFMLSAPNPYKYNVCSTFSLILTLNIHISFWISFWVSLGPLLALLWLPKGFPDPPQVPKWCPNAPKWRSKTNQNQKSHILEKYTVFQCFLMIFDASKTQKWTSWTSFNQFRALKTDIDVLYVTLGAFWGSWRLIWAGFGTQGAALGVHLGAPEASWRVTMAPRRRHFITKIDTYFAYPILDIILGAPGPLWGDILALQRPPGRSKMKSIVHFSSPMLRLCSLAFLMFAYLCVLILPVFADRVGWSGVCWYKWRPLSSCFGHHKSTGQKVSVAAVAVTIRITS